MVSILSVLAHLDKLLVVLAHLGLGQQLGPVRGPVNLQVLPVLSDVGPRPHAAEAPDVDLQDAVGGVPPPDEDGENKVSS